MHYAPWLVIPHMWPQHTLQMFADHYGPKQTIPWETINQGLLQPQGELYPIQTILTITAGISSSSFVRVSTRQLAASSLSEFEAHSIFTRAMVLTGLELATSHTHSECRINWANLTYWKVCVIFNLLLKKHARLPRTEDRTWSALKIKKKSKGSHFRVILKGHWGNDML